MEFILNEKSLHGQFESIEDFLKSLENNIKCFQIIYKDKTNKISKIKDLYKCNITADKKLLHLRECVCVESLLAFQIALEQEIYTLPFWDDDPAHDLSVRYMLEDHEITATGIAEAAEKDQSLVSFASAQYMDRKLTVYKNTDAVIVHSMYTPQYLVEAVGERLKLDRDDMLKIRYENTRIDCSNLEKRFGANCLEQDEFEEVLSSMDKFNKHESWETIAVDDGLELKKYKPDSPKNNWFNGTMYQNKTIMKFRASSVLRVFGYRKGDTFKVLRIERNHEYSDHG